MKHLSYGYTEYMSVQMIVSFAFKLHKNFFLAF